MIINHLRLRKLGTIIQMYDALIKKTVIKNRCSNQSLTAAFVSFCRTTLRISHTSFRLINPL